MKSCNQLLALGRRQFLKGGATAAAATLAAGAISRDARATPALARVTYPSTRLANVKDLKVDQPLQIQYPDKDSPGVLIKPGRKVDAGAGPDGDIVAFSTLCPHKGYPLGYVGPTRLSTVPATIRGLTAKRAASRSGATRPRTCRSSGCASPPMATSSPKASTS